MTNTQTAARVLTVSDAVVLGMVCNTAETCAHVARAFEDGTVIRGEARSIRQLSGDLATREDDVRDCYLRVTTPYGFDSYWLISELMTDLRSGMFLPNVHD